MHAARVIAAAIAVLSFGAITPVAGKRDAVASPLAVSEVNGEAVWRVAHSGVVTLTELIEQYASHYGGTVIYHQNAVRGELQLMPAADGVAYRGTDIDLFFASLLGEFRYCPVETSVGLLTIVHYPEAAGYAPIVCEGDLATHNPGRWVTCVVTPFNTDPGTVGMLSAGGGMRSSLPGPAFAYHLTGRADHVIGKVRTVRELDELRRPVLRVYALPGDIDGERLIEDARRLSGEPAARMVVLSGARKLFVSASERELENIDRVLAVMLD